MEKAMTGKLKVTEGGWNVIHDGEKVGDNNWRNVFPVLNDEGLKICDNGKSVEFELVENTKMSGSVWYAKVK